MEELNKKAVEHLKRISKVIGSIGETEDFTHIAIDAIEKVEKYRWHDIRKNPDDLPEKGSLVEAVSLIQGSEEISYLDYKPDWLPKDWESDWNTLYPVIRWREIEEVGE